MDKDGWERNQANRRWLLKPLPPGSYVGALLSCRRLLTCKDAFMQTISQDVLIELIRLAGSEETVLSYLGARTLTFSSYFRKKINERDEHKFQNAYTLTRASLMEETKGTVVLPGHHQFAAMRKAYMLSSEFISGTLSQSFANCISTFGTHVSLDEKLDEHTGDSPFIVHVPSKPAGVGHWFSELCVDVEDVAIPFCFGIYPFEVNKNFGMSVEVKDVVQWAVSLFNRPSTTYCPILVADTFYTSADSRLLMIELGCSYMLQFKGAKYMALQELMSDFLRHKGDSSIFMHRETREVVCGYVDFRDGNTKKYYLSNAVYQSEAAEIPGTLSIPTLYNNMFSVCDRFNKALGAIEDSIRHMSYKEHFDSYALRVLLLNAYVMYSYSHVGKEGAKDLDAFLFDLGCSLLCKT